MLKHRLPGPVLILLGVIATSPAFAQKPLEASKSPLCTQANSVETLQQQIALTKTLDDTIQRITILIRAADLLWPYRQENARGAFIEAFDLATQNFKQTGDEPRRDPNARNSFALLMSVPDQRYRVINALAKRDPAGARKLSEKMLQAEAEEAVAKNSSNPEVERRTAEKLLGVAMSLIGTDPQAALTFTKISFRYPATILLPSFLFALAKADRPLADQIYQDAVTNYGAAPMDQFLYLSSYPFANTREAGEMPSYRIYTLPEGFAANPLLERIFVERLLNRVQIALETPQEQARAVRYSELEQMYLALRRLEKQIADALPQHAEATSQARDKLLSALNPGAQTKLNSVLSRDNPPKRSFDERIEAAEKLSDPARREQEIVFAVLGVSEDESTEHVVEVIDKITETSVRESLFRWFFLFRAQALIKEKKFAEARKLASRVSDLDGRAYLYSRIAEESLKEAEDQTAAREMLDEVAGSAAKAPKTIVTARALLALANLYARIDVSRGIEELSHAVTAINALDSPDFSSQSVMMKIEGKNFSSFGAFATPGFNPENAFREMSKIDFDGSLYQAGTFRDKTLRSLTTLAVIEPCLTITPAPKSQKKKP